MQRMTPLRQQILELLKKNHLMSASDLLAELHKEHSFVNKTSVYRSLEYLEVERLVCRHVFGANEAVYELFEKHHDHLFCRSCGKLDSIPCMAEFPAQVKNFTVEHHHTTLFGLCRRCAGKLQRRGLLQTVIGR